MKEHQAWTTGAEKIVKDAFVLCRKELDAGYTQEKKKAQNLHRKPKPPPRTHRWQGRYTFAIRCSVDKPKLSHINACAQQVLHEISTTAQDKGPLLIFALGPSFFRTLGIKFKKYKDIQGKFNLAEIHGRKALVFASLSKRQLLARSGYFGIIQQHIEIFLNAVRDIQAGASDVKNVSAPLQELIEHYKFPQTVQEVNKLVEFIIQYSSPGRDPTQHAIALDTETNTLYPHREKLKILNLVVSWKKGHAAAIPLEHSECTWTLNEVFPAVQQLLACSKPKIFHNAKFDLRVLYAKGFTVNRVRWDTMLGEHLLAEDKRGFYGLKFLSAMWLPRYAGYDEALEEIKRKQSRELDAQRKADQGLMAELMELKGAAKKLYEDDGYATIDLKSLNEYGGIDADVTRQMALAQRCRMDQEETWIAAERAKLAKSPYYKNVAAPGTTVKNPLVRLMSNNLIPAVHILTEMESVGVPVDREYLEKLSDELDIAIVQSRAKLMSMVLHASFPGGFNPGSPKQLQVLFFSSGYYHPETRELVTYKGIIPEEDLVYTESGQLSTSAAVLRMLRDRYKCKFSEELLHYRAIMKARGNFIANISALSEEDGRMHTTYHISGTATGRLSSSGENMQNIPPKIGKYNIKRIFIPSRPDYVIVNTDAKAAEVRLYAAYSRDPNLIKALLDGMDPHSFFASSVYNPETVLQGIPAAQRQLTLQTIGIDDTHAWNYEDFQQREYFSGTDKCPGPQVTYGKQLEKLRKNIKRVVFGILYGASKNKISAIVGIPDEQAQAIIDVLFRMFPTIPQYISFTEKQVERLGFVETFLGRRRRFNLDGMTGWMRAKAKRQAVNFKIQSTASDLVIDVLCAAAGPLRDLRAQLLITVHDSLVFEMPKEYVSQVPDLIQRYGVDRISKKYPWMPVPFAWDVEAGPSYGDLQSVDRFLADAPVQIPADTTSLLDEHAIRENFRMNPHIAV